MSDPVLPFSTGGGVLGGAEISAAVQPPATGAPRPGAARGYRAAAGIASDVLNLDEEQERREREERSRAMVAGVSAALREAGRADAQRAGPFSSVAPAGRGPAPPEAAAPALASPDPSYPPPGGRFESEAGPSASTGGYADDPPVGHRLPRWMTSSDPQVQLMAKWLEDAYVKRKRFWQVHATFEWYAQILSLSNVILSALAGISGTTGALGSSQPPLWLQWLTAGAAICASITAAAVRVFRYHDRSKDAKNTARMYTTIKNDIERVLYTVSAPPRPHEATERGVWLDKEMERIQHLINDAIKSEEDTPRDWLNKAQTPWLNMLNMMDPTSWVPALANDKEFQTRLQHHYAGRTRPGKEGRRGKGMWGGVRSRLADPGRDPDFMLPPAPEPPRAPRGAPSLAPRAEGP